MSLSYHAELTTSYAAARARLWPKQKRVNIVAIPSLALPAPVHVREWICQQSAHVWAWKAEKTFANYCNKNADYGEVKGNIHDRIYVEQIIRACSLHFGISVREIKGRRRFMDIVTARHAAAYLSKELTEIRVLEIGRRLGGYDHTSILNGIRSISKRMKTDEKLRADISTIRAMLEAK